MTRPRILIAITAVAAALAGVGVAGLAVAAAAQHMRPGPAADGASPAGSGAGMAAMTGMAGMADMSVTDEFSYLTKMIPHHEEAIESARALQAGTDRPEMRAFAQGIVDTQTREVNQMRAWLAAWYSGRDTTVDYAPMMRDLTGLRGDAPDRAFLQDMIPHHMAAVMMSQRCSPGTWPYTRSWSRSRGTSATPSGPRSCRCTAGSPTGSASPGCLARAAGWATDRRHTLSPAVLVGRVSTKTGIAANVRQPAVARSGWVRQAGGRWNQRRASKSGGRPVGPSSMASGWRLITSAAWCR